MILQQLIKLWDILNRELELLVLVHNPDQSLLHIPHQSRSQVPHYLLENVWLHYSGGMIHYLLHPHVELL